MGVNVTTTGAETLTISVRGGQRLRLQRKVWTPVDNEHALLWLLAPRPSNVIVRTDRELAPYYVTTDDETTRAKANFDRQLHQFTLERGQWLEVDRVAFLYLTRRPPKVRAVTAHEFLTKNPGARVLIQRHGGCGDLMFLTAAVRALRKQHPDAKLWLGTSSDKLGFMSDAGLFDGVLSTVDVYDNAPFDLDVDLRFYVEAYPQQRQMNRMERFAGALGVSCNDDYQMVCRPQTEDCPELEGVVNPLCVDLSGSVWQRGPSYEHAGNVVRGVAADGWTPVGIYDKALPWWPGDVGLNFNGCDYRTAIRLMSRSAVLSVDTGTLHLANALGRPTVGLFGPIPPHLRVAGQPHCAVIESPSPCRNCNGRRERCTSETRAKCFNAISVDSIVEALRGKR